MTASDWVDVGILVFLAVWACLTYLCHKSNLELMKSLADHTSAMSRHEEALNDES